MNLTQHAEARCNQRGMNNDVLEIIQQFGRVIRAPGGVEKFFYGAKEHQNAVAELKKKLKLLERAKNGTLIVAGDDIITSYKLS